MVCGTQKEKNESDNMKSIVSLWPLIMIDGMILTQLSIFRSTHLRLSCCLCEWQKAVCALSTAGDGRWQRTLLAICRRACTKYIIKRLWHRFGNLPIFGSFHNRAIAVRCGQAFMRYTNTCSAYYIIMYCSFGRQRMTSPNLHEFCSV